MGKKIFIASSKELKEDRDAFRQFLSVENDTLHKSGIYLELVQWEYFLDSVPTDRSQDEYNKAVEECDIVVCLLFSKIGKYTKEEVGVAIDSFREKGSPHVLIYFKNAPINSCEIGDEINSLIEFKRYLSEIEYFAPQYKNSDDLHNQFMRQFRELFPIHATGGRDRDNLPERTVRLTAYIPRINKSLVVGRDAALEDLHRKLFDNRQVVLVNGMGGIGKTTLAQVYMDTYWDEYRHIAYISHTSGDIESSFVSSEDFLERLNIKPSESDDSKSLFLSIMRELDRIEVAPNLLVIDNAERDLASIYDRLPSQPHWHVLSTSRENIERFTVVELDFLEENDAVALFRKHYTRGIIDDDGIRELVKAVDFHTLTIEILARTAEKQRLEVSTLKEAIESDLRVNVDTSHSRCRIERITSYLMSIFEISGLSEDEKWLLKQFVCLPSEPIKYDTLHELIQPEKSKREEIFSETLEELSAKGWILKNRENDSFRMHRIIVDVVKRKEEIEITLDDAKSLISSVSGKLSIDQTKDNPVEKFFWIPYGESILDAFLESRDAEISKLQNHLAMVLQDLGEYGKARELLEKAMASDE